MTNKIESIKKLKRPGFYQLITNHEKFTITDDIIVQYNLTKDKELSNEELEVLKKDNEKDKMFLKVCNYIAFQMRSEHEIYMYLIKYDVAEKDINDIIKRLKSLQLIDDKMLASCILESTINNLKGPGVFIQKVKQRKLKIDCQDFIYKSDVEEKVIDKVILKNKDKKTNLPIKKQQEQLYAKLIRDGFSHDLIVHKIKNIVFEDNSEQTLTKELEKLISKYHNQDFKDVKSKIISSLMQKGFSYSDIINKINNLNIN